jgi:predicted DNA-binding transcriptional regulator AlpA
MALILKMKESNYSSWYEKNKQRLSAKRKKLYAENPEYRERALEASRRRRRSEPTLPRPTDAQISFAQAAERIGIGVSTLHDWRSKKFFPEPKRHNGRRLWFNEKQVLLLKNLKEFFRAHGKKPWKIKLQRLKEVVTSISASWD